MKNKSNNKNASSRKAYSYKWAVIGLILSIVAMAAGAIPIGLIGILVAFFGLAYTRRKNKIIAWARTQPIEYQQTWRTDQDIKRAYKNRDSRKRSNNNKH
jgi:hypothetical protein